MTRLSLGLGLGTRLAASGTPTPTPTPSPTAPATIPTLTATPGDGQVVLTWTAPSDGGSAITDYTVQYKLNSSGTWLTFADGVSPVPGATVTGLTNGSAYDFRAAAVNAIGTGPWSDVASATPEGVAQAKPPEDWRTPATVAVSSGLSASAPALSAAQATSASKGRVLLTIPASTSQYVEWTVADVGNVIVSWLWGSVSGSATVALNGADQMHTPRIAGNNQNATRQAIALSVGAGDVIRLTFTAAAEAKVTPLLHTKPATGPFDAHIILGASREANGQTAKDVEAGIIAQFPTRDPIVFNWARGAIKIGTVVSLASQAAGWFGGLVSYAFGGSLNGNDISADRPYDSGQRAAMLGAYESIIASMTALVGAGNICLASTSYRAYLAGSPAGAPAVTPISQATGSLEYNDELLAPLLASRLPHCYDSALGRARADEYLATLYDRANLIDEVHGNGAHYSNVTTMAVDSWYRYIYTGTWGASQSEKRVVTVEAYALLGDAHTGTQALNEHTEATYALAALATSPAKTALASRLALAYKSAWFKVAHEAVAVAESTRLPADVSAAQAAINDAASAGATVTTLQARLDAIVVISVKQTVLIHHGGATAPAGWNASLEGTTVGQKVPNLLNTAGEATGWALDVTVAWGGVTTQTAGASAVPWVPGTVTERVIWVQSSNPAVIKITGLDNGKKYQIELYATRATGTATYTEYLVNGASVGQLKSNNNLTDTIIAANISPVDGSISIGAKRGTPHNNFAYLSATRIQELQ